ncbi:MAG TPA: adenylate/guanylate cyclase domain-containing protein [Actinomycetales bacterium]|nr:adenylate/guanylate cyclase domain-containing protein [Actinomycetales bacterium]
MLFADLVSYTTLAESRDTEDVRDLLSRYFEVCTTVVRRYGGTVEKFIGDAVMAVWGVPSAHEDDAERAVRAGLELVSGVAELAERTGLPELAVRAGVVTGEVSTTVGATDQGMVAGDPVNTASRVQSAARSGQVWVDANTRALTAAAITYTDEGEHLLKGKAEPVQLFRAGAVVAGVGGLQRVDGLEAPLAGRDRELRLVKELFHATEESGRPRLVVVDGEPGVGKSRLAWEFSKYVDGLSSDVMWHQGRCLSYGDGAAYWALAEAVRARLGLVEDSTSAESSDTLTRSLRKIVADDEERAWLQPRLGSLLGHGGNFSREDLFAAWTRFFERVSDGGRTVVLVVDDGQYADSGFLDFLDELVTSARTPIFVLLLARPELMHGRPALGGRRATVVNLEPLPAEAMAALLDGLVEGLPPDARDQLVARAEGVPLYAVETVRALIDRDLVTASGGRYVVSEAAHLDLSQMEAPASLHALVAARLDALTPDERQVVADASVLGLSFTREGIEVLSGSRPSLDDVLLTLARKEVISTETDRFSAERGQYRFVQAVVRQVAYSTLSRRDRKVRHLLVAEHLAAQTDRSDELAVVVAQHLMDAIGVSSADDPDLAELHRRAAGFLSQAASRACALGSYRDGLRLYRLAISHSDDDSTRVELLEEAADAAMVLGEYSTMSELSGEALALRDAAGDPLLAARAVQLHGQALIFAGDQSVAAALLEDRYARILALPHADAARQRILHAMVLLFIYFDPANPRALQLAHDRVRLASRLQDGLQLTQALANLATVESYQGSDEVAQALYQHVVQLSLQLNDWRTLAIAQGNLTDQNMARSPQAAIEIAESAVTTAREHGLHAHSETIAINLVMALWSAGRWERLSTVMQDLVDPAIPHDPQSQSTVMAVDLWRVDAGLEPLAAQVPLTPSDDLQEEAWQQHLRMMRYRTSGDLTAALAMAEGMLANADSGSVTGGDFFMFWSEATRSALMAHDVSLAGRLLSLVEQRQPGEVSPALRAHLLLHRGTFTIADGGDPASAETDLRNGIEAFQTFDSPPYRARAEAVLGRWLLSQGRTDEAAPLLRSARTTFTDLGASAWLAELEQEAAVGRGH